MSILKGTHSGIHAKLTPTYIVTFGYNKFKFITNDAGIGFKKDDIVIVWEEKTKKFVFTFDVNTNDFIRYYEYKFDTYHELKLLEQYWFCKDEKEKERLFKQLSEKSVKTGLFSDVIGRVFSKTIASNVIPVKPMSEPVGQLAYLDF
jgi:hypothetical protein